LLILATPSFLTISSSADAMGAFFFFSRLDRRLAYALTLYGMRFKWIGWNRAHIARHGVSQREAEEVVQSSRSTHRIRKDGTVVTIGRTRQGR
jgi:hypothetical protein